MLDTPFPGAQVKETERDPMTLPPKGQRCLQISKQLPELQLGQQQLGKHPQLPSRISWWEIDIGERCQGQKTIKVHKH